MFPSTAWVAAVALLLLGKTFANTSVQSGIQDDGILNISMTGGDEAPNNALGGYTDWTSPPSSDEIIPHAIDQELFYEKMSSNSSIQDIVLGSVIKMFPQNGSEDSMHQYRFISNSSPFVKMETPDLKSEEDEPVVSGALTNISLVRTVLDLTEWLKAVGVVGRCSISPNLFQDFTMRMFDQLIMKYKVLEGKDIHPRKIRKWEDDLHPIKNILRLLSPSNREANCYEFDDESHFVEKKIERYFLGFDSGVNKFMLKKIHGMIPFLHTSKISSIEKVRAIIHFLCGMSFKLEKYEYKQCKTDISESLASISQFGNIPDAHHQRGSRTKRFLIFNEQEPVLDIERSGYADDYSHDSSYVVVTDQEKNKSPHHLFFGKFGLAIGTYILMIILSFKAFVMSNRGPPGMKGDKGQPGLKGDVGPRGLPGYTGRKGQPGEKGERGFHGTPGDNGTPGDKGEPGKQGHPGTPGTPGERGDQGSKGDKGPPGDVGPKGYPGLQGPRGPRGRPAYYEPTITTGYDARSLSDDVNIRNNIPLTYFGKLDQLKEYTIEDVGGSNETDAEEFSNFTDNGGVDATTEESHTSHSAKLVGPEFTAVPYRKVTRQTGTSVGTIEHHHGHTSNHPHHHHHHVPMNPPRKHHHHQQHHQDDQKHSTSHDVESKDHSSGFEKHAIEVMSGNKSDARTSDVPVERGEDQPVNKTDFYQKMGPDRRRRSVNELSRRQKLVNLPLYNPAGLIVLHPQLSDDHPSEQKQNHPTVRRPGNVSRQTNSPQNIIHSPSGKDGINTSAPLPPTEYAKHEMSLGKEAIVVDAINSLWREHSKVDGCRKCTLFEFLEQQPVMDLDSYIIAGFSLILGASDSLQLLDDVREGKRRGSKMRCRRRKNTCDLDYEKAI